MTTISPMSKEAIALNKAKRAEKRSNNFKTNLAIGATTAATGYAAKVGVQKAPYLASKVINPLGDAIGKFSKFILDNVKYKKPPVPSDPSVIYKYIKEPLNKMNKVLESAGKFVGKVGTAIKENPKMAIAATVITAGLLVLNKIMKKHAKNEGKIDQKYGVIE